MPLGACSEPKFRGRVSINRCNFWSICHRTENYPSKCLYLSTLLIKITIMQISVLIRSPKVKRLQKLRFDENFTVTPKIAYHTIDLLIMTFVLHINDVDNTIDYFLTDVYSTSMYVVIV